MGVGRCRCIPECSRMSLGEASALPPIQWHFHFGLALADSRAWSGVWCLRMNKLLCADGPDYSIFGQFFQNKAIVQWTVSNWPPNFPCHTRKNDKTLRHHPPLLSPMPMPTPASMVRAGSLRTLKDLYIIYRPYIYIYKYIYTLYMYIYMSIYVGTYKYPI